MSLKNKILRMFGVNETRRKWKQAQREAQREEGRGDGPGPSARETTKHCPQCRALVSADERRCPSCKAALPSMAAVRARRALRALLPEENPTTKLVLAVIFGLFVVMTLDAAQATDGAIATALLSPPLQVLERWGAHLRGDFELWRIIASNFLHIGVIHLLFNAFALRQAGPEVERIFGSALAFVLFVATGVGAMAISNQVGGPGLVAGASGSLMGFIGLAAAGGHRDGSSYGRAVRDQMVRWAVMVLFIGIAAEVSGFMAIDNWAHGAGLLLGAGLGMILPIRRLGHTPGTLQRSLVGLGVVLALATVGYGAYGAIDLQLGRKAFDTCVEDIQKRRYGRAVDSCQQALDASPDFAGAYNNFALALLGDERGDEAVEVCRKAAERFAPAALESHAPICVRLLEP